jgi:hypothetical protein
VIFFLTIVGSVRPNSESGWLSVFERPNVATVPLGVMSWLVLGSARSTRGGGGLLDAAGPLGFEEPGVRINAPVSLCSLELGLTPFSSAGAQTQQGNEKKRDRKKGTNRRLYRRPEARRGASSAVAPARVRGTGSISERAATQHGEGVALQVNGDDKKGNSPEIETSSPVRWHRTLVMCFSCSTSPCFVPNSSRCMSKEALDTLSKDSLQTLQTMAKNVVNVTQHETTLVPI